MGPAVVECHSGSAYGERPVTLVWQGERLSVAAVEARWREPGGRGFRVRTTDGRTFELFYGEANDEWWVDLN